MVTKYILHGGNVRAAKDGGEAYFQAIVKGLGNNPKILLCFFARPHEEWQDLYKELSERIAEKLRSDSIKPTFILATEEEYEEQAKKADVLYIAGGDCDQLIDLARKTKGFIDSLSKFKVVAGSSAGAILLSDYHWCCDDREVGRGLGTTHVNPLVHYRSEHYADGDPRGPIDWDAAEKELQSCLSNGQKITYLPESEFITVEK